MNEQAWQLLSEQFEQAKTAYYARSKAINNPYARSTDIELAYLEGEFHALFNIREALLAYRK